MEDSNQKDCRMQCMLKKYPEWLRSMYKLRYWDLREYMEKMEELNKLKKIEIVKPMGLKDFEDVISFRCYDNEILNIMIKNKNIDIETIEEQLKFIDKYKDYLVDSWDVKDCENHKKMLQDSLERLKIEIQFLNELIN